MSVREAAYHDFPLRCELLAFPCRKADNSLDVNRLDDILMLHQIPQCRLPNLVKLLFRELGLQKSALLTPGGSVNPKLTSRLASNISLSVSSSIPNLSPSPFRPSSFPIPAQTTLPLPCAKYPSTSCATPPISLLRAVSGLQLGGNVLGSIPGRPSVRAEKTERG